MTIFSRHRLASAVVVALGSLFSASGFAGGKPNCGDKIPFTYFYSRVNSESAADVEPRVITLDACALYSALNNPMNSPYASFGSAISGVKLVDGEWVVTVPAAVDAGKKGGNTIKLSNFIGGLPDGIFEKVCSGERGGWTPNSVCAYTAGQGNGCNNGYIFDDLAKGPNKCVKADRYLRTNANGVVTGSTKSCASGQILVSGICMNSHQFGAWANTTLGTPSIQAAPMGTVKAGDDNWTVTQAYIGAPVQALTDFRTLVANTEPAVLAQACRSGVGGYTPGSPCAFIASQGTTCTGDSVNLNGRCVPGTWIRDYAMDASGGPFSVKDGVWMVGGKPLSDVQLSDEQKKICPPQSSYLKGSFCAYLCGQGTGDRCAKRIISQQCTTDPIDGSSACDLLPPEGTEDGEPAGSAGGAIAN